MKKQFDVYCSRCRECVDNGKFVEKVGENLTYDSDLHGCLVTVSVKSVEDDNVYSDDFRCCCPHETRDVL